MKRSRFLQDAAAALAERAGVRGRQGTGSGRRFACWADDDVHTVVAPSADKEMCGLALAYGLTDAGHRRLRLILPERRAGATLQRAAFLRPSVRPEVLVYRSYDAVPEPVSVPERTEVIDRFNRFANLSEGFRQATRPLHLRTCASWVRPLVAWVGRQPDLDPAHRQGQRAWHCRGRKVLEIRTRRSDLQITAGIQAVGQHEVVHTDGPLSNAELRRCVELVEQGIGQRLDPDGSHHSADEHWMQSVVRRRPRLAGLETSMREVPAWRRTGPVSHTTRTSWSRGFIDLAGVDAHGCLQIVETKLSTKAHALLVFQMLDYLAWAEAYRAPLTTRLDVHPRAPLAIRALLGSRVADDLRLDRFVPAQLDALDDDIRWSLRTLTDWFVAPLTHPARTSADLDRRQVGELARTAESPDSA